MSGANDEVSEHTSSECDAVHFQRSALTAAQDDIFDDDFFAYSFPTLDLSHCADASAAIAKRLLSVLSQCDQAGTQAMMKLMLRTINAINVAFRQLFDGEVETTSRGSCVEAIFATIEMNVVLHLVQTSVVSETASALSRIEWTTEVRMGRLKLDAQTVEGIQDILRGLALVESQLRQLMKLKPGTSSAGGIASGAKVRRGNRTNHESNHWRREENLALLELPGREGYSTLSASKRAEMHNTWIASQRRINSSAWSDINGMPYTRTYDAMRQHMKILASRGVTLQTLRGSAAAGTDS